MAKQTYPKEPLGAVLPEPKPEPKVNFASNFHKRVGISPDSLKQFFLMKDGETPDPLTPKGKLVNLLKGRVYESRLLCLRNWRIYGAIDLAWNIPFHQTTPTILGKILSGSMKEKEIIEQLKHWDIHSDHLVTRGPDGKDALTLADTTFFKIRVPLVRSVVTARASKIFNDRFGNDPMFSFEPVKTTVEDETIGEIVTQIMQKMTAQLGYKETGRSMVMNPLKYGSCLIFPTEAWYVEYAKDDNGEDYVVKEGLRFNIPHPTRVAWDPNYRPCTFNTDTGCEWALYWEVQRYGDIRSNTLYYNTDRISYGTNWFDPAISGCGHYFSQLYPCVGANPFTAYTGHSEDQKREFMASVYAQTDHDKSLFITNKFAKLVPKQWGLGDYQHPLWFRFVIANDDTVIWAEPLPACPIIYSGYDTDDAYFRQVSLALEALPWQDLVGNVLSQHVMAVKENLTKIVPYDKMQVDNDTMDVLQARSREFNGIQFLPYDSTQSRVEQVDPSKMFTPINIAQHDTTQLITCLNTIFNVMERALQMSAQEVGTVAGHIQTAEEIRTIAGNTTNRVEYTASFVDAAIAAMKTMMWKYAKEFMDEDFVAEVSRVPTDLAQKLKDNYGFELQNLFGNTILVKGKKSRIAVESFLSQREAGTRSMHPQTAQIMLQTVQAVLANPELAQKVSAEWIVQQFNRIAHLAGAPEDFEVKLSPDASTLNEMKQVAMQMQQTIQQITQGAAGQVQQQVEPALKQQGDAIQQTQQASMAMADQISQVKQAVTQLAQVLAQATQPPPPTIVPPPVPQPQPMMPA